MQYPSASLTRAAYFLPLAPCIVLLFSCGGADGDKAIPVKADIPVHAALPASPPSIDCTKNNISYRQEVYDPEERNAARKDFADHFKVEVAGKNEDIMDTVLRIPWKSIEAAQNLVAKPGMPVRGIYINYGLDGDRFHPIIEFMYPDPTNGNLQVFADMPFSFDGKDLKTEPDPKKYTDAYLNNIRVKRKDADFSKLDEQKDEPDPLATWYPYPDKLNNLLSQNPVKDPVLVVSCISQPLCYMAVSLLSAPEFRHLLVLHVADGTTDKLDMEPNAPGNALHNRAMDIGTMCPPKCPPKKP